MKHEELLDKMPLGYWYSQNELNGILRAIRAVVELHKPLENSPYCKACVASDEHYPCSTIQIIEKVLS